MNNNHPGIWMIQNAAPDIGLSSIGRLNLDAIILEFGANRIWVQSGFKPVATPK